MLGGEDEEDHAEEDAGGAQESPQFVDAQVLVTLQVSSHVFVFAGFNLVLSKANHGSGVHVCVPRLAVRLNESRDVSGVKHAILF